ncbi:MAG: DNA mismatch repair protein MutS [Acidobacteriota bacterium]|nr:DNA mismatch repair protein MutS [Acidobacteriota bacterium]
MTPTVKAPATAGQGTTPAMRQYLEAKRQHPDALIFFRMGDFYEMFYEDAVTAAGVLELTLTSRSKDRGGREIPMCGVPWHAADTYLARLVKQGFRVAVCEQVEDPRKARGLVRREVVRVVSPGTYTDAGALEASEPAFLVAVARSGDDCSAVFGLATADLSTGELRVTEHRGDSSAGAAVDELAAVRPREILLPGDVDAACLPGIEHVDVPITAAEPALFDLEQALQTLLGQLGTASLDGFGLVPDEHPAAIRAAGGLVRHLRDTQRAELEHLRTLEFRTRADHLVVDAATFEHLEVLAGAEGRRAGSLLAEIDLTNTPMGGRMLRAWLQRPLASRGPIIDRLDAVDELSREVATRGRLRGELARVQDLERLIARVALGTAGPRDLAALGRSVGILPAARAHAAELQAPLIGVLMDDLDELRDVHDRIAATLGDDPPALARDGGFIRDGVDTDLDELRAISRGARQAIAAMEAAERERTGIGSLKIRFNRVFGYYIEVSAANLHAVPDDYHRKQTIANGERYITPALKEYEEKALGADDRILEREQEIFDGLRQATLAEAGRIQRSARALATLDVLAALAEVAARRNYVKPRVREDGELAIADARHPVVEMRTDSFVPNDVRLNETDHQVVVLTGPNMGGKSTYLRQTALIVLMAQAGSFVPAREAALPIIDRIFARIGAADNLARGHSTFMVEMQETAKIMHQATSRSLVLLDEIGRGTATFDGLSIAWAVAEHLATGAKARPRTLFATHYHELTDLADLHDGVVNYHVAAREWRDDIVFLRKVEAGRSDRSYGIQVARLAGLPPATVARARTILAGLERDELSRGGRPSFSGAAGEIAGQLGLFQEEPPSSVHRAVAERIAAIDLDRLTPLEALVILGELKATLAD